MHRDTIYRDFFQKTLKNAVTLYHIYILIPILEIQEIHHKGVLYGF